jgi:hypothetical protein
MIKNYTIYGERASGTSFLEEAINYNFNIELTWDFGWKHFFGHDQLINTNETLFIGIVRDPHEWLNSLYKKPWHLEYYTDIYGFLNDEFFSINNENTKWQHLEENVKGVTKKLNSEIIEDRNIKTGNRYKNIFECREVKLDYLCNTMPSLVDNYILIKYEDLRDDYINTLKNIENKFKIKRKHHNIAKIEYYKKNKSKKFIKSNNVHYIDIDFIRRHGYFNSNTEKKLGYS